MLKGLSWTDASQLTKVRAWLRGGYILRSHRNHICNHGIRYETIKHVECYRYMVAEMDQRFLERARVGEQNEEGARNGIQIVTLCHGRKRFGILDKCYGKPSH